MIDLKFLRENPDIVKENIKKKFQDYKLPLVDEVIDFDKKNREAKLNGDNLRSERKRLSDEIGKLMKADQKEEAGKIRQEVQSVNSAIEENEELEEKYTEEIRNRMMKIPNIIDDSVPIGKDDSENVEVERFGEPIVPAYEIPHHSFHFIKRHNTINNTTSNHKWWNTICESMINHKITSICKHSFM